jgi:GGDEF domain-containing protein
MVVLNISHFHLYNELYGKEEGDKALVYISTILKAIALQNDGIVSRIQADYFALYVNHLEDYDKVIVFIHKELKEKYNASNISVRLGIYSSNKKVESVDAIIDRAKMVCDEIQFQLNYHLLTQIKIFEYHH